MREGEKIGNQRPENPIVPTPYCFSASNGNKNDIVTAASFQGSPRAPLLAVRRYSFRQYLLAQATTNKVLSRQVARSPRFILLLGASSRPRRRSNCSQHTLRTSLFWTSQTLACPVSALTPKILGARLDFFFERNPHSGSKGQRLSIDPQPNHCSGLGARTRAR